MMALYTLQGQGQSSLPLHHTQHGPLHPVNAQKNNNNNIEPQFSTDIFLMPLSHLSADCTVYKLCFSHLFSDTIFSYFTDPNSPF